MSDTGKHIINNALLGAGTATGAAGLYYLLHGLKNIDTSSVIPSGMSGFRPGARLKKKKPSPSRRKDSPINAYKTANVFSEIAKSTKDMAGNLYNSASDAVGKFIPESYFPGAPKTEGAADAWKNVLGYAAAGAGGYGALSAVTALRNRARRQENKDDVEEARQEYLAAISGKQADCLDSAFAEYEKSAEGGLAGFLDKTFGKYLYSPALGITLGGGLIGGKYMYDRVKDQERQKILQRAAAARARLAGLQNTPYVDPEELALITKKKR